MENIAQSYQKEGHDYFVLNALRSSQGLTKLSPCGESGRGGVEGREIADSLLCIPYLMKSASKNSLSDAPKEIHNNN